MAYELETGDTVRIGYTDEDGERREATGRVEYNTTRLDPDDRMGPPKVRIKCGTGRTASRVVLRNDGTLRRSPYLNANGRGHDGVLSAMELLSTRGWEAVPEDGESEGPFDSKSGAFDALGDRDGHVGTVDVEPDG